jgi:hypothetical protein
VAARMAHGQIVELGRREPVGRTLIAHSVGA